MKTFLISICCVFFIHSNAQLADSATAKFATINNDSVYTKVEVEAAYPGGEKLWNEYIQKAIEKNIKKIMKDKPSSGTCEVQFIVDREGNITNVEALTMKGTTLAQIFTEAIKKGPRWKPSLINGKAVKALRIQKVTFLPPND
jgi:periplasmic protein TonB